ncbi:MAG: hypothetical protein WBV68_02720 [Exiguobacterium oxidotolerans]|uniref:Uncharacterized protein n=1 Tax=Exiguobacterium oxidotolerans TaxID=223958 RepID=A0A653IAR4_9BACL|nr:MULTISPECIES: hypothetical protein [Exiguobacterium]VWX36167.1 conserved hypothetical protein [Exiguobacterium oxidotolerans]
MKRKEVGLMVSLAIASGVAVREWRKNRKFTEQYQRQTQQQLIKEMTEVETDAGDDSTSTKSR